MICRQCGTEIADKAIICFRCGAATTDPVRRPVEVRRSKSRALLVFLVVLVLVSVFVGLAGERVVPPGFGLPVGLTLGVAIVVVVARLLRSPRRR